MNLRLIDAAPSASLAGRLADFERQFDYPLGAADRFRISHGADYTRFFRAMGRATLLVMEEGAAIAGVLATVVRQLRGPDGSECEAVYLGDLKVAPSARGGRALAGLLRGARDLHAGATAGFSVVMEGTAVNPMQYTGRVGVPRFEPLAPLMVLRIPTTNSVDESDVRTVSEAIGTEMYRKLSAGRISPVTISPGERAAHSPVWLALPDCSACGLLEDTLRAKRLIASSGAELLSAHLSAFASATPAAGARLLRRAATLAAGRDLPALFVAVPRGEADALLTALNLPDTICAPAAVYGTGLAAGVPWSVNTSEI
jgi:hypothetical protein